MPEELAPEEGIGIVSAADPVGDETAAGADPAPTPQTEPAAPLAAPEPAQPSTAKPFDWQSVDLRRVDPLTVPREHRAAVEAAQKQVRAVQGDGTRQFEDLSRRERALEDRSKELLTLQQQMLERSTPQAAPEEQVDIIESALNLPNLDNDTRNGVVFIQQAITQEVSKALAPFEEILNSFPDLKDQLGSISADRERELRDGFQKQVAEAVDAYGNDINDWSDDIRRVLGLNADYNPVSEPMMNRATQQPYTVKSAYEFLSGKLQQTAEAARSEDASIRSQGQNLASVTAPMTAPAGDGPMTEGDLRDQVGALFAGAGE